MKSKLQYSKPFFIVTILLIITFLTTLNIDAASESQPCEIQSNNIDGKSFIQANCSNKNQKSIPNDMKSDLQVIIFNSNPIKKMSRNMIQKYTLLERFISTGSNQKLSIDKDMFVDHKKLTHLELVNYKLNKQDLRFPPQIEVLRLEGLGLVCSELTKNLKTITALKELTLDNNKLDFIPMLDQFCPLQRISLKRNPLDIIESRRFARYCRLNYIGFDLNRLKSFLLRNCDCIRLFEWCKDKNITGDPQAMKCTPNAPCAEPYITEEMKQHYANCIQGKKIPIQVPWDTDCHKPIRPKSLIIFVILMIIVTIVILVLGYHYSQEKKKMEAAESAAAATQTPPQQKQT